MRRSLALLVVALGFLAVLAPAASANSGHPVSPTGMEPTELHPRAPADIAVGANNMISAILHDARTEIGLAGENISFSLKTAFGWLALKSTVTDSQGEGFLDYDPVAPGTYTIQVAFAGDAAYAPSNASTTFQAVSGPVAPPTLLPPDRAIVLVIIAVVGGVWATYGFVATQVLGIRADPPEEERKDRRRRSATEEKKTMDEDPETPKRASGNANAGSRTVLIVAALALVLGAAGLGLGAMSALTPRTAAHTPTTVSFEVAIVPDIQGAGWDAFIPNSLVVHAGDTVKITVINADEMDHGFLVDAFNVNVHIDPGTANATGDVTPSMTVITFVASQAGTFVFKCNVVCGDGHDYMTGTLEVLPD